MDIDEVKRTRTKLEYDITELIVKFEREAVVKVADVRVEQETISFGTVGPGPIQYAYGQKRVEVAIAI